MLPVASQMPPRCLPDASRNLQQPPDACSAFQMPLDVSRCLSDADDDDLDDDDDPCMPRCLPNDASPMMHPQ